VSECCRFFYQNKAQSGRAHSLGSSSSADSSNSVRLSMDEVIKGIGSVKLKKIARYQSWGNMDGGKMPPSTAWVNFRLTYRPVCLT